MSKKRLFGLSKWRLGKVEGDYREHKINKRGLSYLDEKVKARPKKKYKCKKLKGQHDFELIESKEFKFFNETFETYRCTACNKKLINIRKK